MAEQVRETLGDTVARLRRESRLSQEMLARACQVTRSTINEIEGGRGNPRLTTLQAIASALGVALAALFTPPSTTAESVSPSSPPDVKLIEQWSPDKILGLMGVLSNIDFVDPEMVRKFENKNANSLRAKCDSYDEVVSIINPIFGTSVMEAAYWISGKPTRHFQRWCAEVGERSEQLLTALGYPILPLEDAADISRDYSHRIAPPLWQILKLLHTKNMDTKSENTLSVLRKNLSEFSVDEVLQPLQTSVEITKYLHLLRTAGRLLPQIVERNTINFRPQSTVGDALFFNIAAAYFLVYRVAPKMTDSERGPYGHATGWAMRILKLGACRLRTALDSGELEEHQGNPWLGYLESELISASRLRRDTIARRMERAWSEVRAVDRGEPRLLATRRVGFLGTKL